MVSLETGGPQPSLTGSADIKSSKDGAMIALLLRGRLAVEGQL